MGEASRRSPLPDRTIDNHGIIGNLNTAALVALDGTVDFLCWPDMDSPTLFAALLDTAEGGEFALRPLLGDPVKRQSYLPDTNVLLTRWSAVAGRASTTPAFCPQPCRSRRAWLFPHPRSPPFT